MRNAGRVVSDLMGMFLAYSRSVGAADGNIMATIIADHIENNSTTCSQSQLAVIIQADAPFIRPYMSTAIGMIHDQQRMTTDSNALPTSQRSRIIADLTVASGIQSQNETQTSMPERSNCDEFENAEVGLQIAHAIRALTRARSR